jgi:hypothetical protein
MKTRRIQRPAKEFFKNEVKQPSPKSKVSPSWSGYQLEATNTLDGSIFLKEALRESSSGLMLPPSSEDHTVISKRNRNSSRSPEKRKTSPLKLGTIAEMDVQVGQELLGSTVTDADIDFDVSFKKVKVI